MTLMILFFCVLFSFFDPFLLIFSLIFSVSILLNTSGTQFSGMVFIDSVSFVLVFLSLLVFLYCFFSSSLDYWTTNFFGGFSLTLTSMGILILLSFCSLSCITLYISFEFLFLLMFMFVMSWGYSPERIQASFYMVFYTIVVSFPFLVYLISLESLSFGLFLEVNNYWWPFYLMVFLVKLPVYGVHLWLPKAHVEAPVSGSMLLAGILLKIGGYGLIRFSSSFLSKISLCMGYFISLGLFGGLISCVLCLRQSDLKAFVAYSSICHMGFSLSGFFVGNWLGFSGGLMMLMAHGFCSSCLFYILFMIYERMYSRSMFVLKGLGLSFPLLSGLWFLFIVYNMGVPPFFSFYSEVLILVGSLSANLTTFLSCASILFLAGVYCVYLYIMCFHGKGENFNSISPISAREYLNVYSHAFFLSFPFLFLSLMF